MKTNLLKSRVCLSVLFVAIQFITLGQKENTVTESKVEHNLKPSTLAFRENKGQIVDQNHHPRPEVLFSGKTGALNFHMKKDGISYQLSRVDSWKKNIEKTHVIPSKGSETPRPDEITLYRVDINWLNANKNVSVATNGTKTKVDNFYLAQCPNGALGVKSYGQVQYNELYAGIDLKWYEKEGQLKYDYLVAPGADYATIQMKIEGADKLEINRKGELEIHTPLGVLIEGTPIVFQDGKRLTANWKISGSTVSYEIKNHNPKLAMVIDPVVRIWGTYYGGNDFDFNEYSSIDSDGNIFVVGNTASTDFIYISSGHQSVYRGDFDAYVIKFNRTNGYPIWGTYFGGISEDQAFGSATDSNKDVYVAGSTESVGYIASGGYDNSHTGDKDAYLSKFNGANGLRIWATYYGGVDLEHGNACAVDSGDNVYLAGETRSSSSNLALGGFQNSYGGYNQDGFLVKFNSAGTRLWATYYGGSTNDYIKTCIVDTLDNIIIGGITTSTNNIAASGYQMTKRSGTDAFIAKFSSNGLTRAWGTYYGGNGDDEANDCTIDGNNNIIFVGSTNSTGYIAYASNYQSGYQGNPKDAFLGKLLPSGTPSWVTYVGGSDDDNSYGCYTDAMNNIYVSGTTYSTTSYGTSGSHQPSFGGGSYDAYISKFNTAGFRLVGSYYGGGAVESGRKCLVDDANAVYLSGTSNSSSNIASSGAYHTVKESNYDSYLVKFNACTPPATPTATNTGPYCQTGTIQLNTPTVSGATYSWTGPGGFTSNLQNPTRPASGNAGTYSVTITVSNCSSSAGSTTVSVSVAPTVDAGVDKASCSGAAVSITGTRGGSATSSTWTTGGTGTFSSTTALTTTYTPSAADITAGTVTITLTTNDPAGPCDAVSDQMVITIAAAPSATFSYSSTAYCTPGSTNPTPIYPMGSSAGVFTATAGLVISSTGVVNLVASPAGVYTVTNTIAAVGGCPQATHSVDITINATPSTPIIDGTDLYCYDSTIFLTTAVIGIYDWKGPNSFTSSIQNPIITNANSIHEGSYSLQVTVNGCVSDTAFVSVMYDEDCDDDNSPEPLDPDPSNPCVPNQTPTPIVSNTGPYCYGDSVLINTTAVGDVFAWAGPSGFTYTLPNAYVGAASATNAGVYSLIVTDHSCLSDTSFTTVVTNPVPVIALGTIVNPTACATTNGSIEITGSATGFITYVDSVSHTINSITLPYTITGLGAGAYTITFTSVGGCVSNILNQTLTDPGAPAPPTITASGPLTFCSGGSVTLTSSASSGNTWNTTPVSNSTAIVVTTSGSYTVTQTVAGCLSSPSAVVNVVVNTSPVISLGYVAIPTNCITADGSIEVVGTGTGSLVIATTDTIPSIALNYTLNSLDDSTYIIQFIDGVGCTSNILSVVISDPTPPTAPTINPSGTVTLCSGNSVVLTSSAGSGNLWSTGETTPSITVNSAATYTVTTTVGGCTSMASAGTTVTINTTPTMSIGSVVNPTTCGGTDGSINILGSGTGTISWTGAEIGSILSVSLPTSIPELESGGYVITFISNSGCPAVSVDTSLVAPGTPAAPIITANGPTTFCEGGSVILSSSATFGNTWSTGDPTQAIMVTTAGIYYVNRTVSGCVSNDSVGISVTVIPSPTINAGANQTVCAGTMVTLTYSGTADVYSWDGGISNSVPFPAPLGSTNYTLTGTDSISGCTGTDVVTIIGNPTPDVNATLAQTNGGCAGSEVTLTGTGADDYEWSNGVENGVPFYPTSTQNYTVTGTTDGCVDSAIILVTIIPIPTAEQAFATATATTICLNTTVVLMGNDGENPFWTGPTGTTYLGNDVTFTNVSESTAGIYVYSVTSSNGCVSTDTVILVLSTQGCVTIPNLITLNGDGNNDDFNIPGLDLYPENELIIFNRWGSVVFEQAPYQNQWAGKTNTGNTFDNDEKTLPIGTYYYVLNLGDGSENIEGFIDLK